MATNSPFDDFESGFEGSSLEAVAILAVDIGNWIAQGRIPLDDAAGDLDGLVSGVVKELDIELFTRVIEAADRIQQSLDDVLLVEDRQLHSDARQFFEVRGWLGRLILLVLVIKIDEPVAMASVGGEDDEDDKVRDQQRKVKGIDLIESLESLVEKVLAEIGAQAFGGDKRCE